MLNSMNSLANNAAIATASKGFQYLASYIKRLVLYLLAYSFWFNDKKPQL